MPPSDAQVSRWVASSVRGVASSEAEVWYAVEGLGGEASSEAEIAPRVRGGPRMGRTTELGRRLAEDWASLGSEEDLGGAPNHGTRQPRPPVASAACDWIQALRAAAAAPRPAAGAPARPPPRSVADMARSHEGDEDLARLSCRAGGAAPYLLGRWRMVERGMGGEGEVGRTPRVGDRGRARSAGRRAWEREGEGWPAAARGRRAARRPALGGRSAAPQQLGSLWKVEEGGRWI
ncbi:hypothetical protein PVAP13_9NG400814 [Panicum virgatum]|uniref:Uncharacterized protein n=1 Tax=Panicum virgatum TaxID=38727 RepID=A0A8T0MN80_PANVG|nr:hypothetical protein PVAP13_9NG400814 [Panicum virgatum]